MQQTLRFLEAVLPAQGLRVVATKPPEWSKGLRHAFLNTNEAVAKVTAHTDGQGTTTYIALATFADRNAGRTAANTVELQSLWLDLDFKQYESQEQGRADAAQLFGAIGVPTIQVQSGNGLHIYWCLRRPMRTAEWRPLAEAFQALWQSLGIKADPVSADAARVLRLPGSHNYKPEYQREDGSYPQVTIESFEDITYDPEALASALGAVAVPQVISVPAGLANNDDLSGGLERRDSHFRPLIHKCRQMQWHLANQAQASEPQWHAMLQLVRHVEDAEKVAHFLSSKHPGYDAKETDDKLAYLERGNIGPTTCARFKMLNPAGCEGCGLNITSPIVLGYIDAQAVEPTVTTTKTVVTSEGVAQQVTQETRPDVEMPFGFRYDGTRITRTVKDPEDDDKLVTIPVYEGFICPERLTVNPYNNYETSIVIYAHPLGQAPRRVLVSGKAITDKRDLVKALSGGSITTMSKSAQHILDLVQSMTQNLRLRKADAEAASQMGWQMNDTFVIGTTCYEEGKPPVYDIPVPKHIQALAPNFEPSGTLDGWRTSAGVYNADDGEAFQFALCYGAAGVFMPFIRSTGVMLSLYSAASGRGKSTAAWGALSWWGRPRALMSQSKDTNNALFNKASRYKNLPLVMDEVTAKPTVELDDLVYYLTQGREKERLTADATPHAVLPEWALPAISTANNSIRGRLQLARGDDQGLAARVLEFHMDLPLSEKLSFADKKTLDNFHLNYAVAGPMLVQWVMANREECARYTQQLEEHLMAWTGSDSAYRFWVASSAATMAVAHFSHKLGLLPYNPQTLLEWTKAMLHEQRDEVRRGRHTPGSILGMFLNTHVNQMVTVRRQQNGTGVRVTPEEGVRGNQIAGRADVIERKLYIATSAFAEYCEKHGFDFSAFKRAARDPHPLNGVNLLHNDTGKQLTLGAGTATPGGRTRTLVFDMHHPDLVEGASVIDPAIKTEASHLKVVT